MAPEKQTKNDRRTAARQKAAEQRAIAQRKAKQKKLAAWISAIVIVSGIAVLVGSILASNIANTVKASPNSPNNMATNGIILTSPTTYVANKGYNLKTGSPEDSSKYTNTLSSKHHVQIYLDYACPHCEEFESTNNDYIKKLLQTGDVSVEYNPIVVIGTELSFAGGNAAGCVANYAPDKFFDLNTQLFTLTSVNGKLSDIKRIINGLHINGDSSGKVNACVNSDQFGTWLKTSTSHGLSLKDDTGNKVVTGTPTILIDGYNFKFGPSTFQPFMNLILAGKTPEEAATQLGADSLNK